MKKTMLFTLITLLIIGIIVPSLYSQEEERSYAGTGKGEAILADLVFLRPLGVVSCALGLAATVVAAPFMCCKDNGREVIDALLTEPGNYTVIRPLGKTD